MTEEYFDTLCYICRGLNLRPDTFLQTGQRYPSTLQYNNPFLELKGFEDSEAVLNTVYVPSEKLEDYIDGSTNEIEYRRSLDKKLPAAPQRHLFDDEGVPEWTVPDKKGLLGSLKDIRLRASDGCTFCQLVSHAFKLLDDESRTARSNGQTNKNIDDDAKCKVTFHFREIPGNMSDENPIANASDVSRVDVDENAEVSCTEAATARQYGYYEATISFGIDASIAMLPVVTEDSEFSWFGGRPFGKLIDRQLIHKWLTQCQTLHQACDTSKQKLNLHLVQTLRVIDVRRWCLTEIDLTTSSFVALSYVWGNAPTLKVTKQNVQQLHQPGALATRVKEIPNTTRDAICFVEAMGLQYLWTDSLCILQDDATEMVPQLRRMDLIYAKSVFTIVAADGVDVAAGLPGSHAERPRQSPKLFRYSSELHLMLDPKPITKILLDCPWTQRLWTLQEAWMSTRLLLFTTHGVHFTCGSLLWSENHKDLSEQHPAPWTQFNEPYFNFRAQIESPISSSPQQFFHLEQWISFAEEASERKLKYEWDIENATAGLMHQLEALYQTRNMYGLPESILEESLLWSPMTRVGLRRRKSKDGSSLYPTWTWMGWVGEVSWPGGDTEVAEAEIEQGVDITKLSSLTGAPQSLSTQGPSKLRDIQEKFPFLLVHGRSMVLHIDKNREVPDRIQELQTFAWSVERPGKSGRKNAYCGWKTRVDSTSPVAVGSIMFDCIPDVPQQDSFPCHLVQIRSEPRQSEDGDYAGQSFYDVLAVKHIEVLNDGAVLAERIGHGRVLVQEAQDLWSRTTTIMR